MRCSCFDMKSTSFRSFNVLFLTLRQSTYVSMRLLSCNAWTLQPSSPNACGVAYRYLGRWFAMVCGFHPRLCGYAETWLMVNSNAWFFSRWMRLSCRTLSGCWRRLFSFPSSWKTWHLSWADGSPSQRSRRSEGRRCNPFRWIVQGKHLLPLRGATCV